MNNSSFPKSSPLITCQKLSKVFYDSGKPISILNGLDFSLYPHEKIAITGASGSGKSTLLHILGCLDYATEGSIQILDHCITEYTPHQLNQIRNRYIGFIYQFHHLLPEFTLFENVAMPLIIQGKSLSVAYSHTEKTLEQLGLAHRAHYKPSQVSGGERQRAAIGRAMITKPLFILADEPTGNLDQETAHHVIDCLCKINNTSLIIVTHDPNIAKRMDRTLRLERGTLVSSESTKPLDRL